MIKKIVVLSVVLLGVGAVLSYAGGPFKYARTWVSSKMKSAEEQVPLDLKIQHAKDEVEKLAPDVRKCMQVIAEQQVEVERLARQNARREQELVRQETAIHKLRNDLKLGNETYVYSGHAYSANEVRSDLKLRFERYKAARESLQRDHQILAARKKSLAANEKRLDEMLAAKKQLEVQIEQLEARWKTLQAAQTTSELEFDDSQLSRTKALIRKLDKELDVRDKMLAADGKLAGLIPVETKPVEIETEDVTREIDSYFNKGETTNKQVVSAPKPGSK